jgi:glycosidase
MSRLLTLGSLIFFILIGCVQCSIDPVDQAYNQQTFVEDWRDEVIYQIMVDRFADGDVNNNYNVDRRKEAAYHGGDWQGIIDRLDYLTDLGVTALWISPVVKNVEEDAGFASYHGYWTQSFIDPNPHFGDLHQLKLLVDACHKRQIKVILDVVTNHIGQLFYYDINRNGQPDIVFFGGGGPGQGSQNQDQDSELRRASEWDPEYDGRGVQGFTALGENGLAPVEWVEMPHLNRVPPEPASFQNPDWYNRKGRVTVWENEAAASFSYRRNQEILGDFPGGLKDLATHRADVRQALTEVFAYWVQEIGFDGFRIDTLKHQESDFFDVFAPQIRQFANNLGKRNFFMFGEAFDGNDELLGSYTHGEGVDSVFYFSAYYRIMQGVFAYGGPTSNVKRLFDERQNPIQTPEILDETAKRMCKVQCTSPDQSTDLIDCSGGIDVCVSRLKDVGIPRYQNTPKKLAPTDHKGQPLVSSQMLVNFIDNHDVARFLYSAIPALLSTDTPDQTRQKKEMGYRRLRNAMAYLLTIDGVPCIYYGTEQNFAGGPDPSNREDMWLSDFNQQGETYQYTKRLIALRKELVALRKGDLVFRWSTDHTNQEIDAGMLAYERTYEDQKALVVMNTQDVEEGTDPRLTQDENQQGMSVGFAPGTLLIDRLHSDGAEFTVDANGVVIVSVPPRMTRILVPKL